MDGWIRLYRSLLKSEVFTDAKLLKVWIWCLARANYRQRWISMSTGRGTTRVEVQPGQFVYGRYVAGRELRVPPSTLRRLMQRLEVMGNIVQKADRHYTVVTICNWETYQDNNQENGPATDQQRTSNGLAMDTDKKERKKEGKKKSADVPIPTELDTEDFRKAWGEWIAYRRENRYPCTERTLTGQLKRCVEGGVSRSVEEIENSIANGWRSLFYTKGSQSGKRTSDRRGRPSGRLLGPRDPDS